MELQLDNSQLESIQKQTGILDTYLDDHSDDPELMAEGLAIDFMEDVAIIMNEKGISRSELSELMNVSRAYVTKLFNTPPNMTLMSIARLGIALNAKPYIGLTTTQPFDLTMKIADTVYTWEWTGRAVSKSSVVGFSDVRDAGGMFENIPQGTPRLPLKVASTD